jgi:hypothetical protein
MDSAMGIISQVIVAGKASGLGRQGEQTSFTSQLQYVANVGLKVNHKLGGKNLQVRSLGDMVEKAPPMWSTKPTMLIGIDVSHPQSFDPSEPSIVGIVASMDRRVLRAVVMLKLSSGNSTGHDCSSTLCCQSCCACKAIGVVVSEVCGSIIHVVWNCRRSFGQYACRIKRIGYREEVVGGMKDDIMELMKLFRQRNNGLKPESIVVYRDGVSQGEFKEVRWTTWMRKGACYQICELGTLWRLSLLHSNSRMLSHSCR